MSFGVQHDHCGGSGVLACIVVVELEVQRAFQIRQPVASVPLQLRPSAPGNRDAVAPAKVRGGDAAETTGCIHSLLVEVAMLDELMICQQLQKRLQRIRKTGCIRDMIRADSVQLDIERVKPCAWIDQHREGLDLVVVLNTGQANLTYAGSIAAGGFNVQRDKAKTAIWHLVRVGESRSGRRADDFWRPVFGSSWLGLVSLRRFGSAAEQPVKKCHTKTSPGNTVTRRMIPADLLFSQLV